MDPIKVVLAALSLADVADQDIKAGYGSLKALIIRKLGDQGAWLQRTLANYERDPDTWAKATEHVLRLLEADNDQDVLDAATDLLKRAERVRPGVTGGLVGHISAQGGRVVVHADQSGTVIFSDVTTDHLGDATTDATPRPRPSPPALQPLPPHQTVGWSSFARRLPWPGRPRRDPVECSVFAPPATGRQAWLLLQVWAHRPEQASVAAAQATAYDAQASQRGFTNLGVEISRGARLTFQLRLPGLAIPERTESLIWQGRPAAVQFSAYVRPGQPLGDVVGTVVVIVDGVPAGHVKFKLSITERALRSQPEPQAQPLGDVARRYEMAFISYASPDRAEVLKRVQMLARLRIKYFQDLLSLEPGARWEKELYRYIDGSDLFLLFWSTAARESTWVRKELLYALDRKTTGELALPEIVPVPIEGPPPVPPPEELAHLHFNDQLLYVMAAERASAT